MLLAGSSKCRSAGALVAVVAIFTAGSLTTATAGAAPTSVTKKPAAMGIQSVSAWEQKFLSRWNEEDRTEYRAASTSNDSWQFYNLGYAMDANVSMFQATGKTQYLDRALLYTNNTIKGAKSSKSIPTSQYKDNYLGWGSFSHPDGDDGGQEYPLYESYMWRYVTNMLVAMKQNSAVYANAKYRQQYNQILSFTQKNMFDKWMSRGSDNIYRSRTHMSAHWAMISIDLYVLVGASAGAKYKTVFTKFDADMRKQLLKTANGGYFWNDEWGLKSEPGQDVSHGNNVLAYIIHARLLGSKAWTNTDIKAFVISLNKTIWPSATKYSEYVDGSGSGDGWFNDGLVDLGAFDVSLQKRLEAHEVGQNIQLYASLARNARVLGAT